MLKCLRTPTVKKNEENHGLKLDLGVVNWYISCGGPLTGFGCARSASCVHNLPAGFKPQVQTQGPRAQSGPAPCFYPVAAPSPPLTVKEQLPLHSPKVTFGLLKATARLMWPPVKMSLTPLV